MTMHCLFYNFDSGFHMFYSFLSLPDLPSSLPCSFFPISLSRLVRLLACSLAPSHSSFQSESNTDEQYPTEQAD